MMMMMTMIMTTTTMMMMMMMVVVVNDDVDGDDATWPLTDVLQCFDDDREKYCLIG